MLEFLLAALREHQDLSLHEKLKLMKDTFLTHRQIGELLLQTSATIAFV